MRQSFLGMNQPSARKSCLSVEVVVVEREAVAAAAAAAEATPSGMTVVMGAAVAGTALPVVQDSL